MFMYACSVCSHIISYYEGSLLYSSIFPTFVCTGLLSAVFWKHTVLFHCSNNYERELKFWGHWMWNYDFVIHL